MQTVDCVLMVLTVTRVTVWWDLPEITVTQVGLCAWTLFINTFECNVMTNLDNEIVTFYFLVWDIEIMSHRFVFFSIQTSTTVSITHVLTVGRVWMASTVTRVTARWDLPEFAVKLVINLFCVQTLF